jgi:hypothetical protein
LSGVARICGQFSHRIALIVPVRWDKRTARPNVCNLFSSRVLSVERQEEIHMKRAPWCVSIAVALVAGCATQPASESEVLVSGIVRHQSSNIQCGIGTVRYCEVDVIDRSKQCGCVDSRAMLGPQ